MIRKFVRKHAPSKRLTTPLELPDIVDKLIYFAPDHSDGELETLRAKLKMLQEIVRNLVSVLSDEQQIKLANLFDYVDEDEFEE